MSILTLSAKLDRTDSSTPWGFRMHGGKDFSSAISIQRVTPGSLAAKCGLQVGDTITRIGDTPADGLFHKEAQNLILRGGNSLELNLQRGGGLRSAAPAAPAPAPQAPVYQPPQPVAQPPSAFSPVQQQPNYNPSPKPFNSPGSSGTVPVAMNKQYNTPINMYSVNNVMDTLANQTASISVSPPGTEDQSGVSPEGPSPPWGGRQPSGPAAPYSAGGRGPAAAASPGTWNPSVPTGPRTMKVGRVGDARNMPAHSGAGRTPICGGCGVTVRGPFISALDKTWCPDHFICANPHCRCSLIDVGFVEEAGQLYCERDYEQYFAPRCAKCGSAIIGEVVNALRQTYHVGCFLCCQCHQPIGAGSFHTEDGKTYCKKDWAALFQTKCYGCQFPIEPGDRWVEALSQNWHSECFNCSTCQVNLEGQSFFAKAGKPFCKKHAGR